jgi:hypothetical protein
MRRMPSVLLHFLFLTMLFMTQAFLKTPILSKSTKNSITKRFLTTNIFIVGKKNGGEEFICKGYEMYETRLTPVMKINTIFLKSDEALVEAIRATKGTVIALDENGSQFSSRDFSNVVYKGLGTTLSIYIYIEMYIYTYIYMYMYENVYAHIYMYKHIYIYNYIYQYIFICNYSYVRLYRGWWSEFEFCYRRFRRFAT